VASGALWAAGAIPSLLNSQHVSFLQPVFSFLCYSCCCDSGIFKLGVTKQKLLSSTAHQAMIYGYSLPSKLDRSCRKNGRQ
jgi:hypothetical protein